MRYGPAVGSIGLILFLDWAGLGLDLGLGMVPAEGPDIIFGMGQLYRFDPHHLNDPQHAQVMPQTLSYYSPSKGQSNQRSTFN